jgi:hypothetical protein
MSCLCRTLFVPVDALGPSSCRSGAGSAPHEAIFLILVSRMQSGVCGGTQPEQTNPTPGAATGFAAPSRKALTGGQGAISVEPA